MAKNAPNELKFLPDMYFHEFYQIPEIFWKIFKIGRFSKFFKILSGIDKTHRNTLLVQKSAHFKHFWPFYGHLKTHFESIFLIYKV